MVGFRNYMDAEPASNYPVPAEERSVTFDATILGYLDVLVTVDFDSDGEGVVSEVMAEGKGGYDITDEPELKCRFDEWIEQAQEMGV